MKKNGGDNSVFERMFSKTIRPHPPHGGCGLFLVKFLKGEKGESYDQAETKGNMSAR
jgi:hypothetical protein